ncbi:MAG: hypothetical protein HYY78_03650 [Betaproteobacteria bacterium]|nr:hypothetical protein [Betaproteobacteria bacterium]
MKLVRSALVAIVALAGSVAAIQGGMAYGQEKTGTAQATGSCFITVAYRDVNGEAKTKTTCIKGGQSQCNAQPNNFCEPPNQPDVISRTCKIVPSCPETQN